MDQILEDSYLFDFYGELLTEHQREIFVDVVLEDYSLGEVAEKYEVSRQAVHDIVKRSRKQLENYEEKLHLIKRFLEVKDLTEEIGREALKLDASGSDKDVVENIKNLAKRITEEL